MARAALLQGQGLCGRHGTFAKSGEEFVQISRQAQHFRKVRYRFRGRHSTFGSGTDFVAGTVLSQGQVQISRQAQHFRDFVAGAALSHQRGAALSQSTVQISRQAQHFRKVRYRFHGRRSTFARSSRRCKVRYRFAAGAALSQGTVQISRQAQHSTFARCGTDFVSGAGLSQGAVQIAPPHDRRSDDSTKGDDDRRNDASAKSALISVNIRQTSRGGWAGGRQHDSAQGALISVHIPKISVGVGGAAAPLLMFEQAMIEQRVMMIEEVMIQERVR